MKKWILLALAGICTYMARRALKREPEVITLLWALIGFSLTASTPSTPKARSTEARLKGVIQGVGSVQTAATNAQNAANNAQNAANNAQNSANNAQNTANNAQNVANGAYSKNGGTINGDVTITGSLTVNGTIFSGFDIHAGNALYIGGNRINPGVLTGGNQPDPPGTYTASWEAGVSHRVNNITAAFGR